MNLQLHLPDDVLDTVAERAAALVLAQLRADAAPDAYLSVDEAAAVLRAQPQRIYDLISARRLRRVKDGRRVLIRRADLDAYLDGGNGR